MAARALANVWVRIIHAMWLRQRLYAAETHLGGAARACWPSRLNYHAIGNLCWVYQASATLSHS